jgi:hypothetical protein
VEYTFADGTKSYDVVRYIPKCYPDFVTYVHGTKCAAQFSGAVHTGVVRMYKDQRIGNEFITWEAPKERYSCWQAEWNVLLNSIRKDLYQNEAERAAKSNLTDIMGRAAMHMGRIITWDEAMNSNFQMVKDIDHMDYDTAPPVLPDANGYYPVPVPGQWVEI